MRVACIGKRDITTIEYAKLVLIGERLAQLGHIIVTGNARGSDQAYAAGANEIDPYLVELHLPWDKYETAVIKWNRNKVYVTGDDPIYRNTAAYHHPAWEKLSRGPRALHTRNVSIIKEADCVIALPNWDKPGGGGTGMGIRLAKHFNIKLYDISNPETMNKLLESLTSKVKGGE
jgi:predicted Rossmann-fold nucleotide-binding protein